MEQINVDTQKNHVGEEQETQILKKFPIAQERKRSILYILLVLLVVLGGVFTGWLLSGKGLGFIKQDNKQEVSKGIEQSQTEAGIADESTLPDSVEGVLVEGGIEGEGTYHLERPGGKSQNVYLTSTVIDLQGFVGKKVKVWGETLSAIHAGWLMDVGKIKIIN